MIPEHIEQLIKESSKQIEFVAGQYYDKLDVERFTKSIVLECINILMTPAVMEWDEESRSELSDYNRGWVSGRLLGIEHIKKHFGVE